MCFWAALCNNADPRAHSHDRIDSLLAIVVGLTPRHIRPKEMEMRKLASPATVVAGISAVLAALLFNSGCTVLGKTGVVLGNLKAPIQVHVREFLPLNRPLSPKVVETVATTDPARRGDQLDSIGPVQEGWQLPGFRRRKRREDVLDDFEEFRKGERDTVVAIAISGGGSKAGMLAAHTMTLLEKRYNQIAGPDATPFVEAVDAFSTVSGGSLYSYHVARHLVRLAAGKKPRRGYLLSLLERLYGQSKRKCDGDANDPRYFFCWTHADRHTSLGLAGLGDRALQSVIGISGFGLLQSLFTDKSYAEDLAQALEYARDWRSVFVPLVDDELKFGHVPVRPRLYFNATSLEAASPFVFTQRLTNLPPYGVPPRTARPALREPEGPEVHDPDNLRHPLVSALTLEAIGSSPSRFSVAYAAAASAAFPFGVEPVRLRMYAHRASDGEAYATRGTASLTDGGVFDNSGLTSAVDLYDYLSRAHSVKHVVVVAINADASEYDTGVAARTYRKGRGLPVALSTPVPTLLGAARSIGTIHYVNKRRGEDVAWGRLKAIEARLRAKEATRELERVEGTPSRVSPALARQIGPDLLSRFEKGPFEARAFERSLYKRFVGEEAESKRTRDRELVHYFPVSLSQLSPLDPYQIESGDSSFDNVREIPTGYWLRRGDVEALEQAAAKLLFSEQPANGGWRVGPTCPGQSEPAYVSRLADAIAFSILRASHGTWNHPLASSVVERWCQEQRAPRSATDGGS